MEDILNILTHNAWIAVHIVVAVIAGILSILICYDNKVFPVMTSIIAIANIIFPLLADIAPVGSVAYYIANIFLWLFLLIEFIWFVFGILALAMAMDT